MSIQIRKGDTVVVIAGKDKNKTGKVLEVSPKTGRVLVEDVNIVTKHNKPRSQQDKGGIVKKPAMIDASNVMVVCPKCEKATRVAHKVVDGKKVRVCKKCGAVLDVEVAKETKKAVKEEKKPAKKETASKAKKSTKADK